MRYYIDQKFLNGEPTEVYYLRRNDSMQIADKYKYAYSDFAEIKAICDCLNSHPVVTYRKVYP